MKAYAPFFYLPISPWGKGIFLSCIGLGMVRLIGECTALAAKGNTDKCTVQYKVHSMCFTWYSLFMPYMSPFHSLYLLTSLLCSQVCTGCLTSHGHSGLCGPWHGMQFATNPEGNQVLLSNVSNPVHRSRYWSRVAQPAAARSAGRKKRIDKDFFFHPCRSYYFFPLVW